MRSQSGKPFGSVRHGRSLVLAVASGPARAILRPSEIERSSFHDELLQLALFGGSRVFTPARPTTADIEDHALVLRHDEWAGAVRLDGQGNLTLRLPLAEASHGMVIIEENVAGVLAAALRYAVAVLDRIDPTERITHVALAATLSGRGDHAVWRTQREQDAFEVITSVQRRRRWSRAEKERIVGAAIEPGAVDSARITADALDALGRADEAKVLRER